MQHIIDNIADIDLSVNGVSSAVEEQNLANGEIVRSVANASSGVQHVANTIDEVKHNTQETGASAASVLEAANDVAKLSEGLHRSLESFLTNIRKETQQDIKN